MSEKRSDAAMAKLYRNSQFEPLEGDLRAVANVATLIRKRLASRRANHETAEGQAQEVTPILRALEAIRVHLPAAMKEGGAAARPLRRLAAESQEYFAAALDLRKHLEAGTGSPGGLGADEVFHALDVLRSFGLHYASVVRGCFRKLHGDEP